MLDKVCNQKQAFNMSFTSEENTVRLMTIHSSKGLEFPVVIVTGLEKQTGREKQEEILFDRSLGFALKYYDDTLKTSYETPVRGLIKERNKKNTVAEEMRLLYVALTRAKYSLHVTFECIEDVRKDRFDGASRFIDYIPRSLPTTIHQPEEVEFYSIKQEFRPPVLSNVDNAMAEEMKENSSKVYPFITDTTLKMKDNVTRLTRESSNIKVEEKDSAISINLQTNADKGSTAHKFLELVDFNRLSDLNAEKQRIISSSLMTEDQFKLFDINRLQNAVNSEIFKLLKGGKIYKEQGFIVSFLAKELYGSESDESVLVQGVIDLLYVKGDEAIIIDYKYSHKSPEGLINTYKTQLDLYAKAVSKVLNKKVVKKAIVNIFDGQTVVLD
jgi:ATP-dependent helicase/nuclease subunit A